ncbi:MAG: 30S ribosomal protein S12 methylthiotransferase RimO [Candidatus Zixiibacteriota bacterium]
MKFFIHKLGCPKNDVDADYIAARLVDAGHTPVSAPNLADTIVVNTCGFINDAKEESIDAILDLAQLKKQGRLKTIYASGCLSQRYGDQMLAQMRELDGAFGLGEVEAIAEAVTVSGRPRKVVRHDVRELAYLDWPSRFLTDSFPYAYIKISDGCDRLCSYCAIPQMRGPYRSRPLAPIVTEARFLATNGKRELILVSQEATLWGSDLGGKPRLVDLLGALESVDGIAWIRLLYLHPARTDRELVDYMADGTKTLDYFDLPLQHVSTPVLRRMKRESNRRTIERLLTDIEKKAPDATVRVSFMVGFPGETDAQFEELCDFVTERRFDRLGVFTFSAEEDTAAAKLAKQIPEKIKIERCDHLMTLQQVIAFEKNNSLIGIETEVIIDTVESETRAEGRTSGDAPEIDQIVLVQGHDLRVGEICRVRIEHADGYDLTGTKVA